MKCIDVGTVLTLALKAGPYSQGLQIGGQSILQAFSFFMQDALYRDRRVSSLQNPAEEEVVASGDTEVDPLQDSADWRSSTLQGSSVEKTYRGVCHDESPAGEAEMPAKLQEAVYSTRPLQPTYYESAGLLVPAYLMLTPNGGIRSFKVLCS